MQFHLTDATLRICGLFWIVGQPMPQNVVMTISACTLPAHALLVRYAEQGAYTDCFSTEVVHPVSFEDYVAAFYNSLPFKLERLVLKLALALPSSDQQASELALGQRDRFAAWKVEARAEQQLLLTDVYGNTRSWLMLENVGSATAPRTRLYFGSAVIPRRDPATGTLRMGASYRVLLGFHKLYSRILLGAARRRLVP